MVNRIFNWLTTKLRAGRCWLRRFFTPPELAKPLRPIVTKYFDEHPESKDAVMKAAYAYHDDLWPDDHAPRHRFGGPERTATCSQCGRSREQVRWDELQPECALPELTKAEAVKMHRYTGAMPWAHCIHCGKSREENADLESPHPIRGTWDVARLLNNPHYGMKPCSDAKQLPEIKDVLKREEEKASALFKRAETDVPKLVAKMGMSGETLAVLHHTHGFSPEIVEGIIAVPPQVMVDYHAAMEKESSRSRAAQKKTVITAQGLAV
jgi:hypothetical protein